MVRAAIHPAIGIARVGNSPTGFFVGPEVTEPATARDQASTATHRGLEAQAARFRVYGYNAAGEVVARADGRTRPTIRWTVHVANRKAAWYQWQMALDIPEAAGSQIPRRNASRQGRRPGGAGHRRRADVDRGREHSGAGVRVPREVPGRPTYTSARSGPTTTGRLLFLGGHGVSASPSGSPIFNPSDPNGFINADGWYDDMSDGPVTAEVTIDGPGDPGRAGWVVTAPPDYGPSVKGVRTLYDLLFDLYVRAGWLPLPARSRSATTSTRSCSGSATSSG